MSTVKKKNIKKTDLYWHLSHECNKIGKGKPNLKLLGLGFTAILYWG